MAKGIERTRPMKICGSVPTGLIRREFATGGRKAALKVAGECLTGITEEQVMAVAEGRASIVGNTHNDNVRIEWHDEDE